MRFMVIVKANEQSEAGDMSGEEMQEMFKEMDIFNQQLADAGALVSAEGLHPSSKGKRIRFSGADRTVIDGPFAETKELVAGYWILELPSMDEAVDWMKRCPNPMAGESYLEIRPIFEAADFGDLMTPEMHEQDARMRAQIAEQHKQ